jgi:hypothetical protein
MDKLSVDVKHEAVTTLVVRQRSRAPLPVPSSPNVLRVVEQS